MDRLKTLKKQKQFDYIYRRGKSFANRQLIIHYAKSRLNCNLIGISISKKVGGAVKRNYLRRVIKEILRKKDLKPGFNIIITVRKSSDELSYAVILKSMEHILKKTGLAL